MIVVSVSYMRFQSMISYHCIQLNKTGTNVIIIIITHQNIICAAITLKNNANLHSPYVCVSLWQGTTNQNSKTILIAMTSGSGFSSSVSLSAYLNRHWSRISCSLALPLTHACSKCIFNAQKSQLPSTSLLLMLLSSLVWFAILFLVLLIFYCIIDCMPCENVIEISIYYSFLVLFADATAAVGRKLSLSV